MHVLPSRGRPRELDRFFTESKPRYGGVVVIDEDDRSYDAFKLRRGWRFLVMPRGGYAAALNFAFEQFPDEPWYSCLGDDLVCDQLFDEKLVGAAGTRGFAYGLDDVQNKPTHPVIGGDLVRAVGWLGHPALTHLYVDTLWGDIAAALGIARQLSVRTTHYHWCVSRARKDGTYCGRLPDRGKETYRWLHESGEFDRIVADLRAMGWRAAA